MNYKKLALILGVSLALVLSGCGAKTPAAPSEQAPAQSTEEQSKPTEQPAQQPAEETQEDGALSAYAELLKAAPALEGEHPELADLSLNYEENLAQFGPHYDLFTCWDLDQDGVPVLVALTTVNARWTNVSVYTYADGAAVLLEDPLDPAAPGTFDQNSTANGAYVTYLCQENHIHSVWRGTDPMGNAAEENHAYALEGTTLTAVDCTAGESVVDFHDAAVVNTAENADALTQQN